ncbi:hypothetical protein SteCoe_25151 [Stentor coeruleus]|uniref:Uncharacterized protein n=1 Tax=Stentor coeruleus TaxID=5963 RepID=A0A1R2BFY8_9CILI|nr:hypothetical protein SteCoe_25151 [Stentor coeruleus]
MMDLETYYQSSQFHSDRYSKSTSDNLQAQELMNLTLNKIPGVYKCTSEKMQFEMTEKNYIAKAQLFFVNPQLNFKVITTSFQEFSLSYYCCINIFHTDFQTTIKVPGLRSYNPTGPLEYISHSQYIFLLKITSAIIKAAVSGASEAELFYLKNCISIFPSYTSNNIILDYMFIQVKTACYRKITPPTYPEYIFAQIMKGSYIPREDTKEYLEVYLMFIKGEVKETKLPIEYFSSILRSDKKISWDLKVKFSELESKGIKNGRMLRLIPLLLEDLEYIEIGCPIDGLYNEIGKLAMEFEESVEGFNECILM